jgi:hypothetical protein
MTAVLKTPQGWESAIEAKIENTSATETGRRDAMCASASEV